MLVKAGSLLYPPSQMAEGRKESKRRKKPNKAYGQWMTRVDRVGPYKAGPEPPEHLHCGGEIPDGPWRGGWWLPRYMLPGAGARDLTTMPPAETCPLGITLRDYQEEALEAWQRDGGHGTVVAQCGAGKTCIGLGAIAELPSPALVLVHTLDLAQQWLDRVRDQLVDTECGLVGAGKREDGARVVVSTLQTLMRWPWAERCRWGSRFGLVISDECHKIPAVKFSEVLSSMPARHRLGLTATPTREDGLSEWVLWSCGPIVAEIDNRRLEAEGCTMRPEIRRVRTDWAPSEHATSYADIISELCEDRKRNGVLLGCVGEQIARGRITLLLSDRVEHCRQLADMVNARWDDGTAVALVGAVSKKKRGKILDDARSGLLRVVTATTVADEGLDVPSLETVILACPSRNLGRIQQRIGRALRPAPDKGRPLVLDVVDRWGPAQGYARKRAGLYRRLGWE